MGASLSPLLDVSESLPGHANPPCEASIPVLVSDLDRSFAPHSVPMPLEPDSLPLSLEEEAPLSGDAYALRY